MSTDFDPSATYDCLFLADRLEKRNSDFTSAEIHLLAYLACLLSLYRNSPLADWGYSFIGNELGAPYSLKLDSALRGLIENGYLKQSEGRFQLTAEGHQELEFLKSLSQFEDRKDCLKGAASSLIAFPVGIVREALSQEPELSNAKALSSTRQLLDGPGIQLLYDQFHNLSAALNIVSPDLRLPAVAWLTALFGSAVQQRG